MKNMSQSGIGNFFGTVVNNGDIEIDNTAIYGIWNWGTINNDGNLKIGMSGGSDNITFYGLSLVVLSSFNNLENGIIENR